MLEEPKKTSNVHSGNESGQPRRLVGMERDIRGLARHAAPALLAALITGACAGASPSPPPKAYRFEEAPAAAQLHGDDSRTWGASWHDFDGDGDADLLAGRHWRPAQLFVNTASGFENANPGSRLLKGGDRHGCAWGEANGDGLPDLYCVQGADKGTGTGPNQMFVRTEAGFSERGEAIGAVDPYGRGRTANWIDFDSDGDLDLFVGNHYREDHPNRTFRNEGGRFVSVDIGLTSQLATVGSSWSDWDRDGDPDLLLHQLEPKPTLAFQNTGGLFERVDIPNVTGRDWSAGAWGDYNGDGWPDLHLVSRTRSWVLHNRRGRFSLQHRMRLNEGRMSVWIDIENDGDLDLYVVQGARSEHYQHVQGATDRRDFVMIRTRGGFVAPIRLPRSAGELANGDAAAASDYNRDGKVDVFVTNGYFHSRGVHSLFTNHSAVGNWIGLDLVGTPANPQGMGARIHVETPTRDYRRQTTDEVNFRAQSESGYVHLGIAGNRAARIEVVWPDGTRDCLRARANRVRKVVIGTLGCRR